MKNPSACFAPCETKRDCCAALKPAALRINLDPLQRSESQASVWGRVVKAPCEIRLG
jgi:hypothetical protein